MNAPYKYDIVGSFLRDKEIKQAREDFSLGKINQSQLEEIENKSIVFSFINCFFPLLITNLVK